MKDFSVAYSESMPCHGPKDLAIEHLSRKQLPWVPSTICLRESCTLPALMLRSNSSVVGSGCRSPLLGLSSLCLKRLAHSSFPWIILGLNQMAKKNQYSPLLFSEGTDQLSGASYFTNLYMCEAYHRLWIAPGYEWKTVFCTHQGHFQYSVVPFGIVNSCATF